MDEKGAWPDGESLALLRLADLPGHQHEQARDFCLAVIKEFYGFDYRPDWHEDLDSLLLDAPSNHYSAFNRGAFWILCDGSGEVVGTAGVRHLGWKPSLVEALSPRYGGNGSRIASLWRLYLRATDRNRGLGTQLNALCEREAAALGYTQLYLHASADATATLAFWKARDYRVIGEFAESVHFDKPIGTSCPTSGPVTTPA